MKFETPQPINLLICPNCKSTGSIGLKRCPECQGMAMGHFTRGRFLFWSSNVTVLVKTAAASGLMRKF